jgi:hypothetical protein
MLEFHPDVEKEVLASYSWYEKQAPGLGEDFLSELENPVIGKIVYEKILTGRWKLENPAPKPLSRWSARKPLSLLC